MKLEDRLGSAGGGTAESCLECFEDRFVGGAVADVVFGPACAVPVWAFESEPIVDTVSRTISKTDVDFLFSFSCVVSFVSDPGRGGTGGISSAGSCSKMCSLDCPEKLNLLFNDLLRLCGRCELCEIGQKRQK